MAAAATALTQNAAATSNQRTVIFFIQDLLQTQEIRKALAFFTPELLNLWAGDSTFKTALARPLGKLISDSLVAGPPAAYPSLADGKFWAGRLEALAPEIADLLFQAGDTLIGGLEELPAQRREKVITALISGLTDGHSGALLTRLAKLLGRLHEDNPRFLTDALRPGVLGWMENTDFGELREVMDNSAADVEAFAGMINDVIWQYPAKLVLALSFLPDLANAAGVILRESVGRFNQVSPDLVADIVLALFRNLDGHTLGRCLQELSELIRKIHTGSALIGDPGTPRFVQDLSNLVEQAAAHLDGAVLAKAFTALAEDGAVLQRALTAALQSNPELWLEQLRRTADRKNPKVRALGHRLAALESLAGDDAAAAVADGVATLDLQAAAEVINLTAVLFNRIQDLRPEALSVLAGQLAEGLDLSACRTAADTIATALGKKLAPVGRALLPGIIREACGWLAPADDEYEADMAAAREMLRSVLKLEAAAS